MTYLRGRRAINLNYLEDRGFIKSKSYSEGCSTYKEEKCIICLMDF